MTVIVGQRLRIPIKLLHPYAKMPTNAYGSDAGWDLKICERCWLDPGSHSDVRTGVAVSIPEGYFGRIVGRSSAMRKRGVIVLEGIIDAGFTGELYSYVYNPGDVVVHLQPDESVAQLIIQPVPQIEWQQVEELPESTRGERGFGSSGR